MRVRSARPHDAEQIYSLFRSVSIGEKDLVRRPKRGFYDYPLGFSDIAERADSPFSVVLENKGQIVAYILAYDLKHLPRGYDDPVHAAFRGVDESVVYADQLYVHPRYPIGIAGRLTDSWDALVRAEKVPGVVTAVPVQPWKNQSSFRFLLARGYSPQGGVHSGNIVLRVFAKPFWPLDTPFDGFGDSLLIRR